MSLKQARRIETALQEALEVVGMETYNSNEHIYTDQAAAKQDTQLKFDELTIKTFNLVDSIFEIRTKIQVANHEYGLDERISKIAKLEAVKRSYQRLAGLRLTGEYRDKSKDSNYNPFGTSTYRHEVDFTKQVNMIKMQIAELKDSCTGTNASKTITLSERTVKVATDLGLV